MNSYCKRYPVTNQRWMTDESELKQPLQASLWLKAMETSVTGNVFSATIHASSSAAVCNDQVIPVTEVSACDYDRKN